MALSISLSRRISFLKALNFSHHLFALTLQRANFEPLLLTEFHQAGFAHRVPCCCRFDRPGRLGGNRLERFPHGWIVRRRQRWSKARRGLRDQSSVQQQTKQSDSHGENRMGAELEN